jgi:hypothetical protein
VSSTRSERVPGTPAAPQVPQDRRSLRHAVSAHVPKPSRRVLAQAGLALVAIAAVAAGVYGVRVDRGGDEAATVGEVIGMPGGEMRVDRVNYWRENQHMKGMPGMKISDPLPKGSRRFWIDVTMHATSGPGIRYAPNTFIISAEGLAPAPPHWSPEGLTTIVPGAQATATFLYQVPEKQGDVVLTVAGSSDSVVIPGPGSKHEDDGH